MSLTSQEAAHLRAVEHLAAEDWVGAMEQFESILKMAPLDMYALHMAYFLALMNGHTKKSRAVLVVPCFSSVASYFLGVI